MYALAQNGYANTFYSAAFRSMGLSLHNFMFVSFDPGGLITVDKPPLSIWLQAASAGIFGFHPLALLLPEALAGVACVGALYWAVRAPFGRRAALAAALALAGFPAFVAVSRDNVPDPLLILLMTLACGVGLRAIENGRTRTLLASAGLVALAFNTKTLAAVLVVPPLALAYALCAPGSLMRRIGQLLAAAAVLAALSLAWLSFVDLTPAAERPYVGGSLDNSEIDLTFDYNGLGRVDGQEGTAGRIPYRPGASLLTAQGPNGGTPTAIYPALSHGEVTAIKSEAGPPGPLRLLDRDLGGQDGWLLPLSLLSLLTLGAGALAAL
ncbi:MAG: glycosyltransferase family 39 protein, partial [Acidobacteriota bacterium]|nr:glycosyltransferase family 39 protein [Acidobacteriota bacterium]